MAEARAVMASLAIRALEVAETLGEEPSDPFQRAQFLRKRKDEVSLLPEKLIVSTFLTRRD